MLLRYIRAERVGNWDLHLSSVVEMTPYMFAYDHTNYAKSRSVYLCDMRLLPISAPSVLMEFEAGSHSVNRSANPFNMVWTDMALEQSENKDTKTLGGIVGFSTNPEAVNRWFLTAHVRTSFTRSLKKMCGLDIEEDDSHHKEPGWRRLARDESDVQKITTLLSTAMKSPFQVTEDEESSLLNIVTGQVPPKEIENQLLNAHTTGLNYMDEFVDERLIKKDKLSKLQLKTFADLKKPFKGTTKDNKTYSIKADRDLFSRLVVIVRRREIDLENIFTYELASVPLSLARLDVHSIRQLRVNCLKNLSAMEATIPLFNLRKSSLHG